MRVCVCVSVCVCVCGCVKERDKEKVRVSQREELALGVTCIFTSDGSESEWRHGPDGRKLA